MKRWHKPTPLFVILQKIGTAMEVLTIEVATAEDKELLLALLPKLNSRVIESNPNSRKQAFIELLNRIHKSGGAGQSFGDASEWQREIRSWDRVLVGREE
jgi:hypothetical protein